MQNECEQITVSPLSLRKENVYVYIYIYIFYVTELVSFNTPLICDFN
jgi:hypothetical protein